MTHWYITVTEIICTIIAPENQNEKKIIVQRISQKKLLKRKIFCIINMKENV